MAKLVGNILVRTQLLLYAEKTGNQQLCLSPAHTIVSVMSLSRPSPAFYLDHHQHPFWLIL